MRLLVSIRDAAEARIALDAGTDIVDAKEPSRGALGPVGAVELQAIAAVVSHHRPLSAALGDVGDPSPATMAAACAATRAGVVMAKLGVPSGAPHERLVADCQQVARILEQHDQPGPSCQLVLAAYADESRGIDHLYEVIGLATQGGAAGVLVDTLGKDGRSLFDILDPRDVAAWVGVAHDAGLCAALAGSLGADHMSIARDCGADVVGVRGAACDGGARNGRISAARVGVLVRAVGKVL